MLDFFINLLETNIDYRSIMLLIFIYLGVLWLMFCFWVYIDARKRYKKFTTAIAFFLIVMLFNFPALIFYLIIRPEREEENIVYIHDGDSSMGGINVPVVNFVGQNGLELSLQIKINNKEVISSLANKMNVNVDFTSDNGEFAQVAKKEEAEITVLSDNDKKEDIKNTNKLKSSLLKRSRNAVGKIRNLSSSLVKDMKSYGKHIEDLDEKNASPADTKVSESKPNENQVKEGTTKEQ
jgi:hypothetical protein